MVTWIVDVIRYRFDIQILAVWGCAVRTDACRTAHRSVQNQDLTEPSGHNTAPRSVLFTRSLRPSNMPITWERSTYQEACAKIPFRSSQSTCRRLSHYQYYALIAGIPDIAVVSYISNMPRNEMGKYLSLYSRTFWPRLGYSPSPAILTEAWV